MNPIGNTVFYSEEIKFRYADEFLARCIGEALCRIYPGHRWEVEVTHKQGICRIYNKHISRWYGYLLKIADIQYDQFNRQMMRIGGDLLERTTLRRDKFSQDDVLNLARDPRGHAHIYLDK